MFDLIGQIFGKLKVLQRASNNRWGNPRWWCQCDCGNSKITEGSSLRNGSTRSCGCLQREGNNLKHGNNRVNKRTQVYRAWVGMFTRCCNTKYEKYPQWGGRGITICKKWNKFENFLADMGHPPTKYHSLDRKDNDKRYCKTNCRWATPKQQARNKRNNRFITLNCKTQCLAAWAEEYDLKGSTIADRLRHGWSIRKAITTPPKKWKT